MSRSERRAMVRRDDAALSLSRQCEILSISRSSLYYRPKGESAEISSAAITGLVANMTSSGTPNPVW